MEHKDPYKEMYLYLCRRFEALRRICNAATIITDDALSESANLYLEHLDHLTFPDGNDELIAKLRELLKDL